MDAKIVGMKGMKVLCVRHIGPYQQIGEAFERLGRAVREAGLDVSRAQWLGIFNDNTDEVPRELLSSDACVTVDEFPDLPADSVLKPLEIPGGTYATARHPGSYSGLHQSWVTLVSSWIPSNGFKPRSAPCFEIYVKGHESTREEAEFITDLYEPVEKSQGF